MSEFVGKSALVTGAGSGIGLECAKKLAAAGASVMLVDLSAERLEAAAEQIRAAGGTCATTTADVSDQAQVEAFVADTIEQFGGLHAAFNNAGIMGPLAPLLDYDAASVRAVMNVNFFGVFHCLQAELRHMVANGGGSIVNTASVAGLNATPQIVGYVTAKHAVVGLTKSAALEYGSKGVRINSVCPGFVETNLVAGFFDDAVHDQIVAAHPIGRVCTAEEVADAAFWLLSSRSSYVHGAEIVVDGGYRVL